MPKRASAGSSSSSDTEHLTERARAGDRAALEALADLAVSPDKSTGKSARRALFALRQAGIEPPPLAPPTRATSAPVSCRATAYATNVDGNGKQLLVFVQEDATGGSPWIASMVNHFTAGLREVAAAKSARREWEQWLASMSDDGEGRYVAEIPTDYAIYLVREGAERARGAGELIPQGFSAIMRRIGEPEGGYDRPLIYDRLSADDVAADQSISHDPKALLADHAFSGWFLSPRSMEAHAVRYIESAESPLELTEAQLKERLERAVDAATDEVMSEGGYLTYKRVLEESALVLDLCGKSHLARMALYHALQLGPDSPPHEQPFLRKIVERSIQLVIALMLEEKRQETGEAAAAPPDGPTVVEP